MDKLWLSISAGLSVFALSVVGRPDVGQVPFVALVFAYALMVLAYITKGWEL